MEEEARFAFNFVPVEQAVSAALQSLHTYTYSPHFRTGLAYHAAMLQHAHPLEPHPECPERLEAVMLGLARSGLYDRMYKLDIVPVQEKEWMLVHTKEYMNSLLHLIKQGGQKQELDEHSIFLSPQTMDAVLMATSCVVSALKEIYNKSVLNALCLVRPPGHHSEKERACGFCFFNHVAIAASVATKQLGFRRVLVLDWDVHFGNGIQHVFEESDQVLYISIHRWDQGRFYPQSPDGSPHAFGRGQGFGYTINIGWNGTGPFGDDAYMAAMNAIVLPAAEAFVPDLVIVAAGFDAAKGDTLGNCQVTPVGFARMLQKLTPLAGGRILMVLEGGYQLQTLTTSMLVCTKVLLGDPIDTSSQTKYEVSAEAKEAIATTIQTHSVLNNEFSKKWTAFYRKKT